MLKYKLLASNITTRYFRIDKEKLDNLEHTVNLWNNSNLSSVISKTSTLLE